MDGDIEFTATDVAMMMALLKVARIKTGNASDDSFVDLAGYAACGGEITANELQCRNALKKFDNIIKEIHDHE